MNSNAIYAKPTFRRERLRRGFTLRQIARVAELTPAVLSRLENGRAVMPTTESKICDALKCNFDQIFEVKEG